MKSSHKLYLHKDTGGTQSEQKKRFGLVPGNALNGLLYRTFLRNWLFIANGDIIKLPLKTFASFMLLSPSSRQATVNPSTKRVELLTQFEVPSFGK